MKVGSPFCERLVACHAQFPIKQVILSLPSFPKLRKMWRSLSSVFLANINQTSIFKNKDKAESVGERA